MNKNLIISGTITTIAGFITLLAISTLFGLIIQVIGMILLLIGIFIKNDSGEEISYQYKDEDE